ncbi:MAG TPA: serine/threonine-protein kinase [Polyangiaceae bacterium]|nr:serine/threonine-protein kinase [Polyangiaceae bacterium]
MVGSAADGDAGGDAAPVLLRDGRYQLLGKLGEGGQGTTFDGIDKRDGRSVAIKRFLVKGASSWKDVELAEREAAVLASLSHPLLPAHVDHFEENGALYLVMEKIEGKNLLELARGGTRFSQEDVLRFLRDASSVLEYLHGRSPPVIHRDVNPKNVLRRADGSFVLVDFGAVRDKLRPEGGSTVVGTFGYMAPEQFQGRAVPASDVFAVGATALRLLTGSEPDKLPHKGLALDVGAALSGTAVSPALRTALERMLEPDPDKRAASLAPLLQRLTREEPRARASSADAPYPRNRADRRREERNRYRQPWDQWGGWDDIAALHEWAQETRHGAKIRKREIKRAWKQAKRDAKRRSKMARRGRPVGGPPLALMLVGLNIAMVVVAVVVGGFVPALLMFLSLFLGRPLREAAQHARDGAAEARRNMLRAQQYLLHGTPMDDPEVDEASAGASPDEDDFDERLRTPVAEEPGRVRIADDGMLETTGEEVAEDRDEQRRAR